MDKDKECRIGEYKDNSVLFHGSIICWGFEEVNQPQCKYLKDCLMDYQNEFIKAGKKRRFNNLLKKLKTNKKGK